MNTQFRIMKEIIIAGCFTLVGTLITLSVELVKIKKESISKDEKKKAIILCSQVKNYFELEKLYIHEIQNLRQKLTKKQYKEKGVQNEFRGKLYKQNGHENLLSLSKIKEFENIFNNL